jgi:predicted DNA-binding transcriptional regulator AlpA
VEHLIVGVAEIAELLGVSRQRVDQLTRRADFPPAVAELASGRLWVRGQVERWAFSDNRLERKRTLSRSEYRVLPWSGLTVGGSSPYMSLQAQLTEQGVQGWRFDHRTLIDYGNGQQIEYAVFVKETEDDEQRAARERERLLRIGRLIEDLAPVAGEPRETGDDEPTAARQRWESTTGLLRQELTGGPKESLERCRHLARQGTRQVDEPSTVAQAREEVIQALVALAA